MFIQTIQGVKKPANTIISVSIKGNANYSVCSFFIHPVYKKRNIVYRQSKKISQIDILC